MSLRSGTDSKTGRFVSVMSPTERFWASVDKSAPNGCWHWVGCILGTGYGQFTVRSDGNKRRYGAHRFSYQLNVGDIPGGLFVCHRCDNPRCVNPEHLFLGTTQDNTADRHRKGRDPRGEASNRSKLTNDKVRQIRALYVPRKFPTRRLAKLFGISQTNVRDIIARKIWSHV